MQKRLFALGLALIFIALAYFGFYEITGAEKVGLPRESIAEPQRFTTQYPNPTPLTLTIVNVFLSVGLACLIVSLFLPKRTVKV